MPVFTKSNPKELRGDYNINKKISSRLMSANAVSGFIGTSKKDTDNYNTLIKLIEDVETQQELFLNNVAWWSDDPETQNSPKPTYLFIPLKKLYNLVSKKSFSLFNLPEDDLQKIKDYVDAMQGYYDKYTEMNDKATRYLQNNDVRFPNDMNIAIGQVEKIKEEIKRIIDLLSVKIQTYKTAFVEPPEKLVMTHEELVGGCSCEYKGNPMYQTKKYLTV